MALRQHVLRLGPLDNATYVLVCERSLECAVVDAGFDPESVIRWVSGQPGSPVLRYLLNTHAHYDHVCGMRSVQEALGGEYWLHPGDRPLLAHLDEQGAAFGFPPALAPTGVHDLADGQRMALGHEAIEVIHTPGHSPGGVCFHAGDDLWVGDTLFAGSIGRTDLLGGSLEELERSIRTKLFPLGDQVRVHPGHGPATTLGRERADNPYVGEGGRFA
jgi:glyoxylase-like metal-dependent hydrolase (beta-lactamase superfamily II)